MKNRSEWKANNHSKHSKFSLINSMKLPNKSQIAYDIKKELHKDNMDKQLLKMNLDMMKNEKSEAKSELTVFERNLKHYKIFYSSNEFPAIKLEKVNDDMKVNELDDIPSCVLSKNQEQK